MNSSIFVPKKINVGYRNRSDTYTGRLAYVIYYDEKGKLRKETSWNNWRDVNIPNDEFDNVPTEGFVLNKHAGGVEHSWGWDARKSYCRVYDPRNFEFEITIENLLYILQNADCIKGKGLQGEFVYGWDGKDLVLLPVESPDYKEICAFNEIIHENKCIKAKDLIVGATYLTKDNFKHIYMGKFDRYERYGNWENKGKHLWFYTGSYFEHYRSMPKNKYIEYCDEECAKNYADIYEELQKCPEFSPFDSSKNEYKYFTLDEFSNGFGKTDRWHYQWFNGCFVSECKNGEKHNFTLRCEDDKLYVVYQEIETEDFWQRNMKLNVEAIDIFPSTTEIVRSTYYGRCTEKEETHMIPVTIEEIFKVMKPMYIQEYLQNGRKYARRYKL